MAPSRKRTSKWSGYYVLDCADLDEAIRWAERIPAAKEGAIEIRPLWTSE